MGIAGVELSPYAVMARLRPVLFASVPIGLGIAAWFPQRVPGWGWLFGLATTCGLTYLFAEKAGDIGREKQAKLWEEWVGAPISPTVMDLRHRESRLNRHTLERYHAKLSELRPDLRLPSTEVEVEDPAAADQVYASCVDYLREATRSRAEFPLVFAANVNYGFRRNLWAIKPWGIAGIVLGFVSCGIRAIVTWRDGGTDWVAIGCGATCGLLLILWLTVVRRTWIRAASDTYSLRLLESLERFGDR